VANKTKEKKSAPLESKATDEWSFPSTVKNNHLSYLIFLTARTHRGLAGELLRPLGLHPGQEILLMQLWDRDGQTQSELIASLGLDASTVTKMVQRLEAQGHLSRAPSSEDRRAIVVKLTSTGKKLRAEIEKMWAALNSSSTGQLTDAEENQLCHLLKKTISSLKERD
jgi:DNA-binding MarR family transcriptional regulator